jgi:hypothetical protein
MPHFAVREWIRLLSFRFPVLVALSRGFSFSCGLPPAQSNPSSMNGTSVTTAPSLEFVQDFSVLAPTSQATLSTVMDSCITYGHCMSVALLLFPQDVDRF